MKPLNHATRVPMLRMLAPVFDSKVICFIIIAGIVTVIKPAQSTKSQFLLVRRLEHMLSLLPGYEMQSSCM